MPRQRRWEPNKRLVYERERRGWSQDDAAREAERVAGGLGLPDLVFTGAQFGRWERGECRPRPPLRRVVCELYEASAEALGLLDQGDGAANRRDLLRMPWCWVLRRWCRRPGAARDWRALRWSPPRSRPFVTR